MGSEVQIISDENGIAVIGSAAVVEKFLLSQGLDSEKLSAQEFPVSRLSSLFGGGGTALDLAGGITESSGRWMKLTAESAKIRENFPLVQSRETGAFFATAREVDGHKFVKNLQFEEGIGSMLANPAVLSGLGGLMAQQAMQQTMQEIANYLAEIDGKVDDILRAQKDHVLADVIGVGLMIKEAMAIRDDVGRVSEVTWSKVQGEASNIAKTQAYALRQLDAIAEKLESKGDFNVLHKAAKEAEKSAQDWLTVLAHCFELQEALGIIELDRIFEIAPEELDSHRQGLTRARESRLQLIEQTSALLVDRIMTASTTANSRVLFNPIQAPEIVRASNQVTGEIVTFRHGLGLEAEKQTAEARRWGEAAGEVRDKVLTASADGVDAAKRFGNSAADRARIAREEFAEKRAVRAAARRERKALEEDA